MVTSVFEIREKILQAYGKYEYIVVPAVKFLVSFLTLLVIDSHIGYNEALSNQLLCVIIALVCALLPANFIAAVLIGVTLVHLYTLSIETMLVAGFLFLLLFLLYFRFSPKDTAMLLILPLAFVAHVEYAVPVIAGLLFTPGAAVAMAFGVIIVKYLAYIETNAAVLSSATIGEKTMENFRTIVDTISHDRAMWVLASAFAATVIVVYFVRRLETAHSWTIAIGVGSVVEIVFLLIGDMQYSTNMNIGQLFLWVIVSVLIELLVEFFCFMVDYTRIENVQFEDDDYYYFVKAVPKVSVTAPARTVKTIAYSDGTIPDPFDLDAPETTTSSSYEK